jgi:RNA polymerase sigma-70 factor (ECF subfamily)
MATSDPHDLLRRARAGEAAALDGLWRAHRRWLAVVVLAHMPAEAELEDLLQEVAVKVVQSVGEVEDPAKLKPWLRSVAANTARSAGRKASLRRRILRRLDPTHHQVADRAAERRAEALEARWAAERALAAARSLDAAYREPLLLRVLQGMSQKEIAQSLQLPETTVETRLARARRMLRERLGETEPHRATARSGR